MILFMDLQDDKTVYRNRNGLEFDPAQGVHQILIPLKFCKVFSMVIPPLPPKERPSLVANSLPALFPGNLEEMEWDFRYLSSRCLVFIMEKDLLHRVQQETGKSTLLSAALFLPEKPEEDIYSFETPDYIELIFIKDNHLDHALSLPVNESKYISSLCREFSNDHPNPETLIYKETSPPLFSKQKGGVDGRFSKNILIGLLLLPLLLLMLNPLLKLKRLKTEWKVLQNRIEIIEGDQPSSADIMSFNEDDLYNIQSVQPVDVYQLFINLRQALQGEGRITSFRLQGKEVQIEVLCRDGLLLTDQLNSLNLWEEFSLDKIQRDEQGWEQILWTGELP